MEYGYAKSISTLAVVLGTIGLVVGGFCLVILLIGLTSGSSSFRADEAVLYSVTCLGGGIVAVSLGQVLRLLIAIESNTRKKLEL